MPLGIDIHAGVNVLRPPPEPELGKIVVPSKVLGG